MRRRSVLAATAVLATSLTAMGASPPTAQAASVPAGFTDSFVASVSRPTTVEWLPNDLVVVLEQRSGRILVGRHGEGLTTALTIAGTCTNSERGMLGFTHDPAFLTNGYVYVYYTRLSGGACVNRVSRFTMVGTTIDRASEWVMLDNISSINGNHNGGDLDIGSDGNLYVAVGDAGRDPRGNSGSGGSNDAAQDLSLLNGKILRVTLGGAPAPGNPFTGAGTAACRTRGNNASTPTSWCQEIYSWGLRNPYRIAFDRNDGSDRFFINDVGQSTYEEVDVGAPVNFGWPTREGPCNQGLTTPCAGPPAGVIDPITWYGRSQGSYITAGAFVPNGLWPAPYDGAYLFGDGGSGRIWLRTADGKVDYGSPFATNAFGLTDMTFGFDAEGRAVLYYVTVGGSLRKITPPTGKSAAATDLKIVPVTPFRGYDTGGAGVGVAPGRVVNGTTRHVDLDPPAGTRAALVNITFDNTAGAGWLRTWPARTLRPATSALNADAAGSTVGNAAIVDLAADGSFVLETSTSARVVIDVMAWMVETGGTSDDGRFAALDPLRLVDNREPAGTILDSGSPNPWSRSGDTVTVDVAGVLGVPDDGTAQAVVVSIAAIAHPALGGWIGAHAGGGVYPGTASVNVTPGDVRTNVAIVPLGPDGTIDLRTKNVTDLVVDQLGYVTSDSAPTSGAGLYDPRDPERIVDSRIPLGFGPMQRLVTQTIAIPDGSSASAVVQNITVTQTSAAGWVVAHPTTDPPVVSSLNYTAPDQTRGAFAVTTLTGSGLERMTSSAGTHIVVDVYGTFSE